MGIFRDDASVPPAPLNGAGVAEVWDLGRPDGGSVDVDGPPKIYRVLWKFGPFVRRWPPTRDVQRKVLNAIDGCPQHMFILECDQPVSLRWWGQWAAYELGEVWPPANVLYRFVDKWTAHDPTERPDLYNQPGYEFTKVQGDRKPGPA